MGSVAGLAEYIVRVSEDNVKQLVLEKGKEKTSNESREDSSFNKVVEKEKSKWRSNPMHGLTMGGLPKPGKENNGVLECKKRPKEETGKEKWERIQNEMDNKDKKRVVQMAKKLKRDGKMKSIKSYFEKKDML